MSSKIPLVVAITYGADTPELAAKLLTQAEPVVFNVGVKTTLLLVKLLTRAISVMLRDDDRTNVFAVILSVTICLCTIALFATCSVKPGASK